MNTNVLHAAIAIGRGIFTDDPVAIVELAEGEYAILIADSGFHFFHGAGIVQAERDTGHRRARGIDLDAGDLLQLIDHRGQRHIAVGIALVDGDVDHILARQIPVRRCELADRVLANCGTHKTHQTLRIRHGGHDQFILIIEEAELCAGQGDIVLIDLLNQQLCRTVGQRGDGLVRVLEGTVHRDRRLRMVLHIAGQGLDLLNGVGAVGNLLKGRQTFAVRNSGRMERAVLAEKPVFNAFQRPVLRIDLSDGEPGNVIRKRSLPDYLTLFIDGEGHLGIIQRIALRGQHLPVGVGTGYGRECGQITVLAGIVAADDFTLAVPHLNQRAGQGCRASFVGLCDPHIRVDDLIVDGQPHLENNLVLLVSELVRDGDAVSGIAEHPSLRGSQLLHIVFPVGIVTDKGQRTVRIGDAGFDQRIGGQRAAGMLDGIAAIQTEDKALAGHVHQPGMNHAVFVMLRGYDFLFFRQRDARGHMLIDGRKARRHHRGGVI